MRTIVAIAGLALGLAAPSSSSSHVQFASLKHGWVAGIPRDTRKDSRLVGRIGGHLLAVAPTRHGNFCEAFARLFAGCRGRDVAIIGPTWGGSNGRMTTIAGDVVAAGGGLYVSFDRRDSSPVRVVWVSPPIAAGFYVIHVPRGVRSAVLLLRSGGRVVARSRTLRVHQH
jgi:hypothetical protein